MKQIAEEPLVLSPTEMRLMKWGMSEREAVALAPRMDVTPASTDAEIEQACIAVLVEVKEASSGRAQVQYLCGQRRDLLRGQR
jgi:hypothetical protein